MTMKRVLINAALLIVLALTILWCFTTGKAHNIMLENLQTTSEGVEYQPFEAIYINFGNNPTLMLEGDIIIEQVKGKKLSMQVDVVDEDDKVLETRTISFNINEITNDKNELRMNVPLFYAKAKKDTTGKK